MRLGELKQIIQNCGVVGAGGAGFPTHLKLDARAETILLNCAECEPLFTAHQRLLARYTDEILSALRTLTEVLDASAVIAVKKSHTETVRVVREKIYGERSRQEAPVRGIQGSGVRLALLEDAYPAGDEILLVYEALGFVPPPGTFPLDAGCVVLNVETVYNIHNALAHGTPVTHKWLTVAGAVARPVTARLPLGTTAGEAVRYAGGAAGDDLVFLMGGPMMGRIVPPSEPITKTTNAVLVLPGDHTLARRSAANPSAEIKRAASACCQCRACTDMCPRYLLGYPVEPHRVMRAVNARGADAEAFRGTLYCSLCGLCEKYACPQSLAPRSLMRLVKTALTQAGIKPEKREAAPVSSVRACRRVSGSRLTARLGLAGYDLDAPMREDGDLS